MSTTGIVWTERVWNPTTGCDRVSPGCDHCYAMGMARRLKAMGQAKYQRDGDPRTSGPGFGVSEHMDTLTAPLAWRKPAKVFVNSMSDLFHSEVSDGFIAKVFAVMALTPQHTYQVLTKRHARMRALLQEPAFEQAVYRAVDALIHDTPLSDTASFRALCNAYDGMRYRFGWPLPNLHLGVSAENQRWADIRIPALLDTPAAVRWVSAEPLLGPIDFVHWLTGDRSVPGGLSWAVVGGESGPGARPMELEWAEQIVDQFRAAGVPVLVKQLGSAGGRRDHHDISTFPKSLQVRQYPGEVPQ